jgi:hypothetical protein
MSLSRHGEDGVPVTCVEDGSLLGQIQNPNRGNGPCLGSMLNITLPGSLSNAVNQDFLSLSLSLLTEFCSVV